MQKLYTAVLRAFVLIQAFLDQNASLLAEVNASTARKTLDDVLDRLGEGSHTQSVNTRLSKGARARHVAARRALVDQHMRAIVRVARAESGQAPDLAGLTAPLARTSTADLVRSAMSLADVAKRHNAVFAAALGVRYLDQLLKAVKEVQEASTMGQESRAKRVGATASVSAEVARGRRAVAVLDVLVKRELAGNITLMAQWNSRRTIVVRGQRESNPETGVVESTSEIAA